MLVAARLPCAARVRRGLAKLGCASNNASPDPPAAALLGSLQGWRAVRPQAWGGLYMFSAIDLQKLPVARLVQPIARLFRVQRSISTLTRLKEVFALCLNCIRSSTEQCFLG